MNIRKHRKPILVALLAIPILYIFAPLVKMFPVGLGLKMLAVSAIFIVLIFGLLLPIFHQQKKKNNLQFLFGILTLVFFGITTFNSEFSVDKKRPNSLVYVQNEESKIAYFGTYNSTFDDYISQKLGENPTEGSIKNATTSSKYGTRFKYHTRTNNLQIATSTIISKVDSVKISADKKPYSITIKPQRKLTKLEVSSAGKAKIDSLYVNNVLISKGKKIKLDKGTFIIYYFANTDKDLNLKFNVLDGLKPEFILNEVSNDLSTNPIFKMKPRTEIMMPMPFVTNDAVVTSKKLEL